MAPAQTEDAKVKATTEREAGFEAAQYFVGASFSAASGTALSEAQTNNIDGASFVINLSDVKHEVSAAQVNQSPDPAVVAAQQLEALERGVNSLKDLYQGAQEAFVKSLAQSGLDKTAQQELANNLFGDTPRIIGQLNETRKEITDIINDAETFTATQETVGRYKELQSSFEDNLSALEQVTNKFQKGSKTTQAIKNINSLRESLNILAESPLINVQEKPVVALENPFEPQFAEVKISDERLISNATASAEPVKWEEIEAAVRERQRAKELEQRDTSFAKLLKSSVDAALPLDRKLTHLDNLSIAEHLAEKLSEQVRAVEEEAQALDKKSQIEGEKAQLEEDIEKLNSQLEPLYQKQDQLKAYLHQDETEIKALEEQLKARDDEAASASGVSGSTEEEAAKPASLFARVINVVGRRLPSSEPSKSDLLATNDTNNQSQMENIGSQRGKLDGLKKKTQEQQEELTDIKKQIQQLIDAKYPNQRKILQLEIDIQNLGENSPESLPNNVETKLRTVVRETCKDLHFQNPQDKSHPIVRALLDVSIPKTDKKIPQLSSITDPLVELGAKKEADGSVSVTHPRTGARIKISPRSEHSLDATLTIYSPDGKEVVSDRIWNHNLTDLVAHFLKHGSAETNPATIEQWKVTDELTAPKESVAEEGSTAEASQEVTDKSAEQEASSTAEQSAEAKPKDGITPQAANLVDYLKEQLTEAGLNPQEPQLKDPSVRSNMIRIRGADSTPVVTALLDQKEMTWSLLGDALGATKLTTFEAISKAVAFFKKLTTEQVQEAQAGAGAPESAAEEPAQNVAQEKTPLQQAAQSLFDKFKDTVIHVWGEGRSQFDAIKGILQKIEVNDSGYFEVTYSALEDFSSPPIRQGSKQRVGSASMKEDTLRNAVKTGELAVWTGMNGMTVRFTGQKADEATKA
jgi:hypothetical protein